MSGQSVKGHGWRRAAVMALSVLVLLAVLAAGASLAAGSSSPSPADGTVTLRLGWSEDPLNLNSFVGYSNSHEVWVLRRGCGKTVEE